MGKKAPKATRKFASSGQLKKVIQARHKHREIKKKIQSRRGGKRGAQTRDAEEDEDEEHEDEEEKPVVKKSRKSATVDDLLGGDFMNEASDEEEDDLDDHEMAADMSDEDEVDEDPDEDLDQEDDASFASVDHLEDDGETHLMELSKLAEKDPEFYKYLQENDKELLNFDPNEMFEGEAEDEGEEQGDEDGDGHKMDQDLAPILTKQILQKWQKALLEKHSLRALRKLLIAFRSAAHMNEDDAVLAWRIDSSSTYQKLVTTALRYTPVVLEHHVPYKTLPNKKIKPPTQTTKLKTLQKLILSYFNNVVHILSQLTDDDMLQLAVTQSARIVPYVTTSRQAVKLYLKKCLELWSSAHDSVRIAAFLAIRRLASMTDESIMDNVLKRAYLTLLRSSKSTNVHTLPSINLMKNSASEVFCINHATGYQHAFGYIRQLAIHLRNSMKVKTKEAYKQVYNWQYVHCIDFWSIVLARACDVQAQTENGGKESELKPLIYPLVQVSVGAIKLVSNSRSYPFHLHIIRSLLHLSKHTQTYIPLSPHLVPMIWTTLGSSSRPKASTLKPVDLEVQIRTPQQYVRTRVYAEGVVEEATYLLGEWLCGPVVQGSVAFPEIAVPIVVHLRKSLKAAAAKNRSGKEVAVVKGLLERIEENVRWVEQRRKGITFGPGRLEEVRRWEREAKDKIGESPLGKYVKVQRKTREQRQKLVEKARKGEDEILEE